MVRDAALRASKYESKLDSSVIGSRFAAQQDSMITQQAEAAANQVNVETSARIIIEAAGVSTIFFSSYINFARALDKLNRKFQN